MIRLALAFALGFCAVFALTPARAEGWSAVTTNGVTVRSFTPAPRPEPVFIPVPAPAPPTTVIINQERERYVPTYGPVYPLPVFPVKPRRHPHARH